MVLLYQFPRHTLVGRDVPCNCSVDTRCMICEGSLAFCVTCHGAEASLPTCCPGYTMPGVVETDVMFGVLDYDARDGWVQRSNAAPARRYARRT